LQRGIPAYLIDRGLLDAAFVVDGDIEIVELPRRHANLQVRFRALPESEDHSGYFLKQALVGDREAALAHEAAVYESLRAAAASPLAVYLPEFVLYDREAKLLVLELQPHARTLRDYHASSGRFSKTLAAHLGKALAALHETRVPDALPLSGAAPWVLRAHQPAFGFFCELSAASVDLLGVLQSSEELCAVLGESAAQWRQDRFVHNDVRWDNCLVFPRSNERRTTGFKLVDWELADCGDAFWDVGAALSEYLAFWLLSIPSASGVAPQELPDLARHPVERMQPSIRTFWRSYVAGRNLEASDAEDGLIRSIRYAAARLVQAAIENAQVSPALTGFGVLCLQLALNVGTQPERTASQLLGLDLHALASP
jgi:hypothetical protein